MKLFTGWVMSAGLVVAAGAANAQVLAPYEAGRSPYRVGVRLRRALCGDAAGSASSRLWPGYGPRLLPPHEVYTVLRDSGFSPLGIPVRRGFIYTISVIDRGGDDGRLVIDARTGRILRFLPASRMGDNFDDALTDLWPARSAPPAGDAGASRARRAPAPKVASRTPGVPVPKPRAGEAGRWPPTTPAVQPAQPAAAPPAQQSAAACRRNRPIRRPPARSPPPRPPRLVEAKPAPQILPTQDMPKAQGLE